MHATPSSSKTTSVAAVTTRVITSSKTTTTTNSTQKSPKSVRAPTHTDAAITDPSSEIEEISKKISEHADAIYRTWKCRGLAPTELLEFYTSTAVEAETTASRSTGGASDASAAVGMSGSDDLLLQNDGSTEGLQKLVNSFVIKDKEQRGVKIATTSSNKSQITAAMKAKNAEATTTTNNMAAAIKTTQKRSAKTTTRMATTTASGKNNACIQNVNDIAEDHKTAASSTSSLLYGKKLEQAERAGGGTSGSGLAAKSKTLTKDIVIDLNLGLDLELTSLTLTQTQNLRKIKDLLQQKEQEEEQETINNHHNNNSNSNDTRTTPAAAVKVKSAKASKLEAQNNVTITPAKTTKQSALATRRTDNANNKKLAIGKIGNNLGGSSRDLTDVATTDMATTNNDKNSGNKQPNSSATAKVNAKSLHDAIQSKSQPQQQQQSAQPIAISKTREDIKTTTTIAKNSQKSVVKSTTHESGVVSNNVKTPRAAEKQPSAEKPFSSSSSSVAAERKDSKSSVGAETVMEVARSNMPAPTKMKSTRPLTNGQDKNLGRPILTRGSVAERVMLFEKCPDVRNSFLNIKRPDPGDAPPKALLKVKLHATPPQPPEQNSLQREIRSTKSVYIPRFYFPHGKPQPQIALERTLRGILSAFDSFPNNQVTKDELPRILKLCGLPFYWRMPVMVFCQQQHNTGLVERQRFVEFWKQMNVYCHEEASRFVYILSRGQRFRSWISPEDLAPLVQDVVETHPGLAFLKEATEFHSRYVHTVIARIFYSVNRSWSGKISIAELKKSDLLEIISLLEEEDDINQVLAFFSYEHFYVIYCKFWELDKDHDLLINQEDLSRHSDHALSTRIVERIFSGCVTRGDKQKSTADEPKMSYTDFVWFLLSEEDKRTPTAIEYWFRCMDVDGDGALSMYELEYFYEEQQQRMESIGIETLPFEDCLCQMLDMIKPQRQDCVSLSDLKRCKMTHVFFDTFFNLEKYLDHEQRDPFASQRDEYSSDWDRFAAQEYELLITEEND